MTELQGSGVFTFPNFLYGEVLVGGLGLGQFQRMALERFPTIMITTVENDQQVIDKYEKTYGNHSRHRIVFGDYFEYEDEDKFTFMVNDTGEGAVGWKCLFSFTPEGIKEYVN